MARDNHGQKAPNTRRTFLKSAGTLTAATLIHSPAPGADENLAVLGGPKAVTYPKAGQASRWPLFGPEDEKAVLDVLRNPSYRPIADLERDWKDYYKIPYARAHCSGTAAITAMFFALNLPPGSEIMVPSYTFFATIVPLRLFDLVPVFVDINPRTLCFDVADAQRRLTPNTKAVFPVHWLGLPADMDDISAFADKHGLSVLEDAAHAHGVSLKGKLMGTWGRMAIFSYQMSKPVPAMEGGMGMYQRAEDYERASAFGQIEAPNSFPVSSPYHRYVGTTLGTKFRMHPLAAALVRRQMQVMDTRNDAGVAQVRRLNDRLIQLEGLSEQRTRPDAKRLYYGANVLFLDEGKAGISRQALIKALLAEGVQARENTYPLQHKMALYRESKWWHHPPLLPELPGSEEVNRTAIRLPYFTSDVPELVDQYVKAFEKVWGQRKKLARS
jgi:dTDP-4-amino-4,6-dideoxygalactose transaminase